VIVAGSGDPDRNTGLACAIDRYTHPGDTARNAQAHGGLREDFNTVERHSIASDAPERSHTIDDALDI
jgi:hypothetical protein